MSRKPWEVIQPTGSSAIDIGGDSISPAAPASSLVSSSGLGMGGLGLGMGGLGLGMGGLGMGMGMYGMGMNQDSLMYRSLQTIESANYAVSSFSQVTRTLESNASGMSQLYGSMVGLASRLGGLFVSGLRKVGRAGIAVLNLLLWLLGLKQIQLSRPEEETEQEEDPSTLEAKQRKKHRLLAWLGRLAVVLLAVAFVLTNLRRRSKLTKF